MGCALPRVFSTQLIKFSYLGIFKDPNPSTLNCAFVSPVRVDDVNLSHTDFLGLHLGQGLLGGPGGAEKLCFWPLRTEPPYAEHENSHSACRSGLWLSVKEFRVGRRTQGWTVAMQLCFKFKMCFLFSGKVNSFFPHLVLCWHSACRVFHREVWSLLWVCCFLEEDIFKIFGGGVVKEELQGNVHNKVLR